MRFQKGKSKTGGKIKGSRNKKTLMLENFTKVCIEGGMEKFQKELMKLRGGEFVRQYIALLEYVQPRLARSETTINPSEDFKKLIVERKLIG